MKQKTSILCLLLCLTVWLQTACTSDAAREKPIITVSVEPLHCITKAIAGDHFEIRTLMPAGSSPETYQLTPQQLMDIKESAAYIRIGTLGFEQTCLPKITENTPHLNMINASQGIMLLPDEDGCNTTEGGDPHTWTSPRNVKCIAANICDALCNIDTTATDTYISRLHNFFDYVDSLDSDIRKQLAKAETRTFLIYHPALSYFASDYDLEQLSVQHEGKDPSAERMARLIDECKKKKVKTVLIQEEYTGQAARRIAEEIGAKVVTINPLGHHQREELLKIATALSE